MSALPAVSWQAIYTVLAPSEPKFGVTQDCDVVPPPEHVTDISPYAWSVKDTLQVAFSFVSNVMV